MAAIFGLLNAEESQNSAARPKKQLRSKLRTLHDGLKLRLVTTRMERHIVVCQINAPPARTYYSAGTADGGHGGGV
jgi:hypothetical protein